MPGNQFAYDLPSLALNPSMVGVAQKVTTGNLNDGWLLVYNETPYDLMVFTQSDNVLHPCAPQVIVKIALHAGDDVIFVTPVLYLPGAAPSTLVKFKLFPYGEPDGDFPVALPRQTTSVGPESTAQGFVLIEALNLAGSAAAAFAIANPNGNTKNFVFYECIISSGGLNSGVFAAIGWTSISNLGNNITANIGSNQSSSSIVSSATASDRTSGGFPSPTPWGQGVISSTPFNYFQYPDKKLLLPNKMFLVGIANGLNADTYVITTAWTEH